MQIVVQLVVDESINKLIRLLRMQQMVELVVHTQTERHNGEVRAVTLNDVQ